MNESSGRSPLTNLLDAAAAAVVHMRRHGCAQDMIAILDEAVEKAQAYEEKHYAVSCQGADGPFTVSFAWNHAAVEHPFVTGYYREQSPHYFRVEDTEIAWIAAEMGQSYPQETMTALMSSTQLRPLVIDLVAQDISAGRWGEQMEMMLSDEEVVH